VTPDQRAAWRNDLMIAAALLHAMRWYAVETADPAHRESLRKMVDRLDEMRGQV
jgi:hypothetical protein